MAFDIAELLEKLPPLPWLRSKKLIGIDLGSHSIKVVQLEGTADKLHLARWSVIPITGLADASATELTPEEKKSKITTTLRNYRGSGKGIPKNIVSSVSGSSVIVRYVNLPKLTRKELSKTIKAEAEPHIPFNIEEVFLGFYPLRDVMERGKQKMETVLVVAKKDFVNQKIEIFEEAGFRPMVIDVDAFALESAYESMQGLPPPDETILIANIGHSQTNFVIIERGVSRVVKDSPSSGSTITKAIVKGLGVETVVAENLKITNGLLVTSEEKERTQSEGRKEALGVSNAIAAIAKDLVSEIKRLIDFYTKQADGRQVNRILLSGGSANIKNLDLLLSKELNLPVEKMDPFIKISGSETVPDEYRPLLAVAVGLAKRRIRET